MRTELTPVEMRDRIKAAGLDSNDEVLVLDVTSDAAAWTGFNAKGSQWLKDNL